MFIKLRHRRAAWTMVETMVATGLFSLFSVAFLMTYVFSVRSFTAISNYSLLDSKNRQAMDLLTREIRQALKVNSYTANPATLSIVNGDGDTVIYSFDPDARQMVRDSSDGSHQVLLTNCTLLDFDVRQRNPSNGVWGIFPTATDQWQKTAKVIQLSWRTSMEISPTANITSENIQTARIVIRKQRKE